MGRAILNVFMYHRVLPEATDDGVSVPTFRRQVRHLRDHYRLLSGPELLSWLTGEDVPARPCAALTFDDGWLDNWLYATPVLQELGVPAVLALSTGFLHDGPLRAGTAVSAACVGRNEAFRQALYAGDRSAYLSRAEVRAMVASGVWSVEAHGHVHAQGYGAVDPTVSVYPAADHWSLRYALEGEEPFAGAPVRHLRSISAGPRLRLSPALLTRLRQGTALAAALATEPEPLAAAETAEAFRDRLRLDLGCCREAIRTLTGRPTEMLFWPWGQCSAAALAVAREVGFRFTFSVKVGAVLPGPDPQRPLPRIGVGESLVRLVRRGVILRRPWLARLDGRLHPGTRAEPAPAEPGRPPTRAARTASRAKAGRDPA